MNITDSLYTLNPGEIVGIVLVILVVALLVLIGLWIYTSFAWMSIGKKLRHKHPWLAWIPFARGAMILQLGGFSWQWIFLSLSGIFLLFALGGIALAILGMVLAGIGVAALYILGLISRWRIFEKRKYPGWYSLSLLFTGLPYIGYILGILYLVVLGIVAWKDKR